MTLRRTIRVLPIAVASGALLAGSLTATATTSSAEESASTTASWVTTSEDDVPTATFTAVVPYDRPALRRLARQVSRPDGRRFRQFLTLEQAAEKLKGKAAPVVAAQEQLAATTVCVEIDATAAPKKDGAKTDEKAKEADKGQS